jgi:hypothetical protein
VDIGSGRGGNGFGPSSYPTYADIRQRASTLENVYAYSRFPEAMSVGGDASCSRAILLLWVDPSTPISVFSSCR